MYATVLKLLLVPHHNIFQGKPPGERDFRDVVYDITQFKSKLVEVQFSITNFFLE